MENFRLTVFRTVADNLNFRQAAEALSHRVEREAWWLGERN
jgi:hypothetical protein